MCVCVCVCVRIIAVCVFVCIIILCVGCVCWGGRYESCRRREKQTQILWCFTTIYGWSDSIACICSWPNLLLIFFLTTQLIVSMGGASTVCLSVIRASVNIEYWVIIVHCEGNYYHIFHFSIGHVWNGQSIVYNTQIKRLKREKFSTFIQVYLRFSVYQNKLLVWIWAP